MPKVSVVVPVYNVEQYLNRCVQSLLKQTLNDFEIILVDDGSPDRCPKMCDEWALTDNRIRVVHKKNGGLSSARNAGINIAVGDYIGFVDSDDDVELDFLQKMVYAAEKYNVDFVMCDYQRYCLDGSHFLKTLEIDPGYYSKEKVMKCIYPELIMGESIEYGPLLSVWHCMYRREFLEKHNIIFDEKVRWSEDNIFSAVVGYYADSFYYLKGEGLYHYWQNTGTITTSYKNGAWDVYRTMNQHLHDFFDHVKDYNFRRQLKLHLLYYTFVCINQEKQTKGLKAVQSIRSILNCAELKEVFCDFKLPRVYWKTKVYLICIKYRMAIILTLI